MLVAPLMGSSGRLTSALFPCHGEIVDHTGDLENAPIDFVLQEW